MLGTDTGIFFRIPDGSNTRVLHPARIVEVSGETHTAEVEDPQISLEAGQELLVYYEMKREFVQQSAIIDVIMDGQPEGEQPEEASEDAARLLVAFRLNGEPVSAESRQAYRVSTVVANLFSMFGKEERCRLLDVSATGFSLESRQRFSVGDIIEGTLLFEDKEFTGLATVQSIKPLSGGRFRYGLHSVEDKTRPADLLKGQQKISMAIQREQMRRLRGTA